MNSLLSADPGTRALGWALSEDGRIVSCGLLQAKSCSEMLSTIGAYFDGFECEQLVIEKPKVYTRGAKKVDPSDLILVALVGGAIAGAVRTTAIHLPEPADWKGQVPKEVMQKRIKKLLSADEVATIDEAMATVSRGVRHNVWDAIGINLWKTKRLTR